MENTRDLVKQFSGKNIYMEYYIDNSYRIGGDPQYRRICKFDGRTVYDSKLRIEEIKQSDFENLKSYAYNIGAYNRKVNAYCRYDYTYSFRVI